MTGGLAGRGSADAELSSDEGAREIIRHDLDGTHFVEAGAGTGKTSALVGRILELVADGRARIDEIAAITFTEAAAAELRERVRQELERNASDRPCERRDRVRAALLDIESAPISTLHGFARRLLAEHPFEAGLPPRFEVLDGVRSSVAFEERWAEFVEHSLLGASTLRPLTRAVVCGITLDHLRSLALRCNENWDLVSDHPWTPGTGPALDVGAMVDPIERAAQLSSMCTSPADALLARLEQMAAWAVEVSGADSEIARLRLIIQMPGTSQRLAGRKGNWGGKIEEVRELLGTAVAARSALIESVAGAALTELLAQIGTWTLNAAADRCREGRLEFHDLLVQARDLLRHRPDVVGEIAEQYRYLLIDEFQDTDPIQAELAVRIAARSPEATTLEWTTLEVTPGRLFFVGDPKQAIYRFRRADISQYMSVRDRFAERPLALTRNHRSVPGLLAWVNAVFGRLLGEGDPSVQPQYIDLEAFRLPSPAVPSGPPVLLLGSAGDRGESVDAVRRREGRDVAAVVQQVVEEGWPVDDEARPAYWSDIAILVPSRTGLPHLLSGLDAAGVRYQLEATSLIYAAQAVQDLLAVLRSVDDPTDELALVAALRSPLFACGDDDLVEHRSHGGTWDYRTSVPPQLGDAHPVGLAFRSLHELHRDRWWCDVSELLQRVLTQRRVFELALETPRPREVWRQLRFVAEDARTYSEAFGGDLRRYLEWVDQQRDDNARAGEVVLPEADDDAVRIMTVHAAKGLEFPVVVMAGLETKVSTPSGARILWGPDGPQVAVPGVVSSAGFDALDEVEAKMDRGERYRQLYVAATRARDHLVVCLHRRADSDCPAAWIEQVAVDVPELCRVVDSPGVGLTGAPRKVAPGARLVGGLEDPDDAVDRRTWQEGRGAILEQNRIPRAVAATAVAKLVSFGATAYDSTTAGTGAGGDPSDQTEEGSVSPAQDHTAWRRGRAGTAIGRAVHAVLQSVNLATGEGLEELARAQAVAEGVPRRAREVARLAQTALESEVVHRAVDSGRYWRELYVGVPLGDRVLEGIVDLVVDGPEGLEVVDYKTDQVLDAGELATLPDSYRFQVAAYALALETALGRPVARGTILYLHPGGAIEVEVAELTSAVATVGAAFA